MRQVTSLPVTELTVGHEWNGTSGNWDSSRGTIDRIVIHTMDGTITSANARFNNPASCVSAHYGVGTDGSIVHWVDEDNTAYQSGNYAMNQRSIGIEHEDNGDYNGVRPDVLYQTSARLVKDICMYYNIPVDRQHILKHSEVSATGCPDALDIDRIVSEATPPKPPKPLPEPNPGYAPTQPNQDVNSHGVHYHSFDGKLWVIVPETPTEPPTTPQPTPVPPSFIELLREFFRRIFG